MQCDHLDLWLHGFDLSDAIRPHVRWVVTQLPDVVKTDLVEDPSFFLCEYEYGRMSHIPVGTPRVGNPGRSVALRKTLRDREQPFIHWLIAHELAHAFLRNKGRFPDEDPEHAADALAAEWGFPRPAR